MADIWVDLPSMEGGPDRVSMDQLKLVHSRDVFPDAAWNGLAIAALRAWFHEVRPRDWAGRVTIERTPRSTADAPEIIVHKTSLNEVLSRISPGQIEG